MAKKENRVERNKILNLLSKGLISADEAEKLLLAIGEEEELPVVEQPTKKTPFRMLKILVDSADGDNIKVQIPIEFAKLLKSSRFNVDKLDDLNLDMDALIGMINSGAVGELVNITSEDGDVIVIKVE